jgi:phage FluMu protein Com
VDDPDFEHRTADYVRTVKCPVCGQVNETPRDEPWLLAGGEEHAPMLVSIRCKFCDAEIRLTDE